MTADIVRVTGDPITLDEVVRAIGHQLTAADGPGDDPEAGALVTFSGIVREREGLGTITHLDYEQYEGMALREIGKLVVVARERWPLRRVALYHRVGRVNVAEASVIVAVSAGHRAEAFAAARFLIDELKLKVPIWKSALRAR
jgi:molybdopterin synthase catalytic subunit